MSMQAAGLACPQFVCYVITLRFGTDMELELKEKDKNTSMELKGNSTNKFSDHIHRLWDSI